MIKYTVILNDAPKPWQIGFQDGATPTMEGIVELHDQILFYLIAVLTLISWLLSSILYQYSSSRNLFSAKYENHGTMLELVWTITPAFILIAIAFPSFKLLYLMDNSIFEIDFSHLALIPIKKLNSSSKALVPHGIVGSTIFIRYNDYARNSTTFPKHVVSQLVGHLLGDGALVMSNTSKTPYFVFTQTLKRFDYIWSVFLQLSHYCSQYPSLTISRKIYHFMRFHTRVYPVMSSLEGLFYSIVDGKRTKTISPDLLFHLDPIGLAYWAMDDGAKAGSGFYLHTKAYSFNEAYLLAGILHYNFKLDCSVQNHKNTPVINIKAKSMPLFRAIVLPYFHPSMTYKLN